MITLWTEGRRLLSGMLQKVEKLFLVVRPFTNDVPRSMIDFHVYCQAISFR